MKENIKSSQTESGIADEVLREVWRIKDELSASYGHNLDRVFIETRERQRLSGRPFVNLERQENEHKA